MAIVDVNFGYNEIIPEISKCYNGTNLRFTTEFVDTTHSLPIDAASQLFKLLVERGKSTKENANVVHGVPS
eukprot:15347845-Ditylum_brightwellii.AAC.1